MGGVPSQQSSGCVARQLDDVIAPLFHKSPTVMRYSLTVLQRSLTALLHTSVTALHSSLTVLHKVRAQPMDCVAKICVTVLFSSLTPVRYTDL